MANQLNLNCQSTFKNQLKYSFRGKSEPRDLGKGVPGPGTYGNKTTTTEAFPTHKDKYRTSESFSISPAPTAGEKTWASLPGPGTYKELKSASDPRFGAEPRWVFGSESRLPKDRRDRVPGPGNYEVRGKLDGQSSSMSSLHEGVKVRLTPGPGAYKPGDKNRFRNSVSVSFGANLRKPLAPSSTPGPGAYESKSLLAGGPTKQASASYTMKGRYSQPKMDTTPGPPHCGTTFK